MKSSYAIAYANKDGRDFNGIPWILDDLENKEDCLAKAVDMVRTGFKRVIPFQFEQKRKKMEEFDWEYVNKHKISMN